MKFFAFVVSVPVIAMLATLAIGYVAIYAPWLIMALGCAAFASMIFGSVLKNHQANFPPASAEREQQNKVSNK